MSEQAKDVTVETVAETKTQNEASCCGPSCCSTATESNGN